MKKNYLKPEAKYVSFYSEDEITSVLDVNDFTGSTTSDVNGSLGETDTDFDWT